MFPVSSDFLSELFLKSSVPIYHHSLMCSYFHIMFQVSCFTSDPAVSFLIKSRLYTDTFTGKHMLGFSLVHNII
jgi:hypothetical protein